MLLKGAYCVGEHFVDPQSLSKQSKETKVCIFSLGMRSENFMCMEFYEPHIKPDIL